MTNDKGFSLFELLVTISIIAIVTCIATPSFLSWRNSAIVRSSAFNIKSDLERAKIQAMTKKNTVRINFFREGYGAFFDLNENGQMEENEKIFENRLDGAFIDPDETRFGSRQYARFNSRGMLTSETTAGGKIVVKLGNHEQIINVSRAGRIRLF